MLGLLTVQLLGACTGVAVNVPIQLSSSREFPPSERTRVWGRAVTAFQMTGRIVALTDSVGGVLQSAPQRSTVRCTIRNDYFADPQTEFCDSVEFTQFTVSDEGVAFLSVTRNVAGVVYRDGDRAGVVTEKTEKSLQRELDGLLDYIVGVSKKPPEPRNPPLSAEPVKI
jgi:hypothetical protein